MKLAPLIALITLALFVISAYSFVISPGPCMPYADKCLHCSDCSACLHCSVNKGQCSVCK